MDSKSERHVPVTIRFATRIARVFSPPAATKKLRSGEKSRVLRSHCRSVGDNSFHLVEALAAPGAQVDFHHAFAGLVTTVAVVVPLVSSPGVSGYAAWAPRLPINLRQGAGPLARTLVDQLFMCCLTTKKKSEITLRTALAVAERLCQATRRIDTSRISRSGHRVWRSAPARSRSLMLRTTIGSRPVSHWT
jgi:hypothetical protein